MKKPFDLSNLFLIIVALESILMVLVVYFLQININVQEELTAFETQRFAMMQAANQLRQSSEDLTRLSRTYVITGDKKYREDFFQVLDIRNGKAPRPIHYESIYWDYLEPLRSQLHPAGKPLSLETIMQDLPYSKDERAKLRESYQNSDDLVHLEVEAFNAMEGKFKDKIGQFSAQKHPDQQYAISLLYSHAYFLAKQKIMKPIDEFIVMLNDRSLDIISSLLRKTNIYNRLVEATIGIFFLTNILVFLILHQRIIKVIRNVTRQIKKSKGEFLQLSTAAEGSTDELGMLISEFNSVHSELADKTHLLERTNKTLLEQRAMIDQHIMLTETDLSGAITYASKAFCKLTGYTLRELTGQNYRIIHHKDMPQELFEKLWLRLEKTGKWQGQLKNKTIDGSIYWVEIIIEPIVNESGEKIGYRSIQTDISDQKRVEKLSITDKLTGLYNRLKLDEVFEYEIKQAKRYGIPLSVVLLDIDKFKHVNDTFGHQVGDTVLQEIASLLLKNVRAVDTVGRWGGEEFLILCPQTTLKESANIAQKLRESIEIHSFPHVVRQTASFGVAAYSKDDTKEDIVGRADRALYEAKAKGRNQVVFLDNAGVFGFPTIQ